MNSSIKNRFFVLILFTVIFLILNFSTGSILENDGFYYLQRGALITSAQNFLTLPQLPFTTLAHNLPGLHFLFPLILLPFAFLFSPLIGGKIYVALMAGALFGFFYYFLIKFKN